LPFSFAYFFWANKRNRLAAKKRKSEKTAGADWLRNWLSILEITDKSSNQIGHETDYHTSLELLAG
jgi:hypothetical protein